MTFQTFIIAFGSAFISTVVLYFVTRAAVAGGIIDARKELELRRLQSKQTGTDSKTLRSENTLVTKSGKVFQRKTT